MRVRFIRHSSFLVEVPSASLLFDYYQGNTGAIPADKPLYVLSSHSHGDHYGRIIYSFPERHRDVRYILSSDIPAGDIPAGFGSPVHFIGPHEEYADELLKLSTLRSNDRGVAFVCEIDGLRLYHGGDLNNWCWDEGQTAKEDERIYHEELGRIEGTVFDAAFIPMDSRLSDFHKGITDFMRHCDAGAIFPMHCWGDFGKIDEFLRLPQTAPYRERVMRIGEDGQEFDITVFS